MIYCLIMDEDENLSMLLSMGFQDIDEARNALQMAKNDLNEAVAILTNEAPISSYGGGSQVSPVGPSLPTNLSMGGGRGDVDMKDMSTDDEAGFPVPNLYELEQRVFKDDWNIPYRRNESLGKCLSAATRLARQTAKDWSALDEGGGEGGVGCRMDRDDHCRKFLDRVLPEAFRKLLTSPATSKWNAEIQEGILDMAELFVETLTARLEYPPVPNKLLETLALVRVNVVVVGFFLHTLPLG